MPSAPSIDPSIKVEKTFLYRGAQKLFTNRYYFDNLAPVDATHWTTLSDAVVTAEKAIFASGVVTITNTWGYDAGTEVPVFQKSYATASTGTFTGAVAAPGDCAVVVRYSTAQRTLKNHPIYLFNYYHSAYFASPGAADTLATVQKTAMTTYATAWVTGFSDGTTTHHRCGPQGHVATGVLVSPYIKHRDFS